MRCTTTFPAVGVSDEKRWTNSFGIQLVQLFGATFGVSYFDSCPIINQARSFGDEVGRMLNGATKLDIRLRSA